MKLIIDIPESAYEAYKEWDKSGVATVEQTIIARGTPYVEQPTGEWIPVETRLMTPDERKKLAELFDCPYSCTEGETTIISKMPSDGQNILVSKSWGVDIDTADNDVDGDGFVYYGLEVNGDWDGIDAWMPLPEPYTKKDDNNQQFPEFEKLINEIDNLRGDDHG